MYRSERVARGYVSDLVECRRALRHLERDLRGADRVETITSGVRVHSGATTTDFTLTNGVMRRAGGGRIRTVGRRIAAFSASQDGRRVDVRVVLQRRSASSTAREAAIHTVVFLRGGAR